MQVGAGVGGSGPILDGSTNNQAEGNMKEKKIYELERLRDCFERLMLLQGEISALAIKVNCEECSTEELNEVALYCQLAGDLRGVVLSYRPAVESWQPEKRPGVVGRCAAWACSAFGGGAA